MNSMLVLSALVGVCVAVSAQTCTFQSSAETARSLASMLDLYVAGQDEATDALLSKVAAWTRTAPLLLLLTGPTRVAKTLCANLCADALLPTNGTRSRPGFVQISAQELVGYVGNAAHGQASQPWQDVVQKLRPAVQRRIAEALTNCNGHAVVILDEMLPASDTHTLPDEYFRSFDFLAPMIDPARHSFQYEGVDYDTSKVVFLFISHLHVSAMQRLLQEIQKQTTGFSVLTAMKTRITDRVTQQWGQVLNLRRNANAIIPFLPVDATRAKEIAKRHISLALLPSNKLLSNVESDVGINPRALFREHGDPHSGAKPQIQLHVQPLTVLEMDMLASLAASRIFLDYSEGSGRPVSQPSSCLPAAAIPTEDMVVLRGSQDIKRDIPADLREKLITVPLTRLVQEHLHTKPWTHYVLGEGTEQKATTVAVLRASVVLSVSCSNNQVHVKSQVHVSPREVEFITRGFFSSSTSRIPVPNANAIYNGVLASISYDTLLPPRELKQISCGFSADLPQRLQYLWDEYEKSNETQFQLAYDASRRWNRQAALKLVLAGSSDDELMELSTNLVTAFVPDGGKASDAVVRFDFSHGSIDQALQKFARALDVCEGQVVVVLEGLHTDSKLNDIQKATLQAVLASSYSYKQRTFDTSQVVIVMHVITSSRGVDLAVEATAYIKSLGLQTRGMHVIPVGQSDDLEIEASESKDVAHFIVIALVTLSTVTFLYNKMRQNDDPWKPRRTPTPRTEDEDEISEDHNGQQPQGVPSNDLVPVRSG